jgi:hypothetical protein
LVSGRSGPKILCVQTAGAGARYTRDGIDGILGARMTSPGAPRSILFIIDELEVGGSQR